MRTPVGDRYVLERMRADGYNVGGEQSGHIILSDYSTTGDGLVAALQMLAVVKRHNRPVSEICHRFEPLPQILKNVRYKAGKPMESAAVITAIASAEKKLGQGGRLLVRPSGTEPVIRVMGEGDDKALVEAGGRRCDRGADQGGGVGAAIDRSRVGLRSGLSKPFFSRGTRGAEMRQQGGLGDGG